MKLDSIPIARIVGVHGIRGDVKLLPLDRDPDFLASCKTFYLDGRPIAVSACRVHKGMALLKLENIDGRDAAEALRGKVLSIRRADVRLPDGEYFDEELLGLDVYDGGTGARVGELVRVEHYPASRVYTIRGEREFLIPAVKDAFILNVDLENHRMDIRMWEGL